MRKSNTRKQSTAVVFAYHDIGVSALETLISLGVHISLVITHENNPDELIWFSSVERLATLNDIPVIMPRDPNTAEVMEKVRECSPDFIFSFYYRHMLGADILSIPSRAAFNLHGSLLPEYRGRVPVNWAIIHNETQTGVSLHHMTLKPDAGDLVDQQAIPILPNDTASRVMQKATVAAELLLLRCVPSLVDGSAEAKPLDLAAGSYYGGRTPEDGRIDWSQGAQDIHNFVRALAPPYPGAFFDIADDRIEILGSYFRHQKAAGSCVRIYWHDGRCWADCADGKRLCVTALSNRKGALPYDAFVSQYGHELVIRR